MLIPAPPDVLFATIRNHDGSATDGLYETISNENGYFYLDSAGTIYMDVGGGRAIPISPDTVIYGPEVSNDDSSSEDLVQLIAGVPFILKIHISARRVLT
jgi:hypothetical protein